MATVGGPVAIDAAGAGVSGRLSPGRFSKTKMPCWLGQAACRRADASPFGRRLVSMAVRRWARFADPIMAGNLPAVRSLTVRKSKSVHGRPGNAPFKCQRDPRSGD